MVRYSLKTGAKIAALLAACALSACLFGGEQDLPPSAGPALSNSAPKPGWYKGDYGALSEFGIESEIILSANGEFHFTGIRQNEANFRMKGAWRATGSSLTVFQHQRSSSASSAFMRWSGFPDFTDSIVVYRNGSFKRLEPSPIESFGVDFDSATQVVKIVPRIWVTYRPATPDPLDSITYNYAESSTDPVHPFQINSTIDLSGCDAGKFIFTTFFLGGKVWGRPPTADEPGWQREEMVAEKWSRQGSFIVAEKFKQRLVTDTSIGTWSVSDGEYLLRIIPLDSVSFTLWWPNDGVNSGFWTPLYAQGPAPCKSLPVVAHNPPRAGWYKGDYGDLAPYGIESEITLAADSTLQFMGILRNFVVLRDKGDWSASESALTITNHAASQPMFDALGDFDPLHSGIFDFWTSLSDTTYRIRAYQDGSFDRYESVLEYFDVNTDSIPTLVKNSPWMWVRYRPAVLDSIAIGRYEYRENSILGSTPIPSLYRDIDFRGCDSGKFSSRLYALNPEGRLAWIPPGVTGFFGYELEAPQWSRIGSFIVARNFQERVVDEIGPSAWNTSRGEYLMRIRSPQGGGKGLDLWWNGDALYPGYWTTFQNDTASCPVPAPSPQALFRAAASVR